MTTKHSGEAAEPGRGPAELTSLGRRAADLENALADVVNQKSQLECLNQIRTHIVSHAFHELRGPLVAIRGYARLMLRAGGISDSQREYLTVLVENAEKMARLLDEYGEVISEPRLHLESFDVCPIWQDLLQAARPQALEKEITLEDRFSSKPFVLAGDREQLAKVLSSLLSQTLALTRQGGRIQAEFARKDGEVIIRFSPQGDSASPEPGWNRLPVEHVIRAHGGRFSAIKGERFSAMITLPDIELRRDQSLNA